MSKILDHVYTPRTNDEIFRELEEIGLPRELKEQYQITDDIPLLIKETIESIIHRLLQRNNLTDTVSAPSIYLSLEDTENAFVLTAAKNPILVITHKLLKNVISEEELAGCIAHELGHIILYVESESADHHNKIEELAADNIAVTLLYHADYNTNGLITFLNKVGGCNSQLITTTDISNTNSFYTNLERLCDPHPSDPVRVRTMTTHITALKRKGIFSKQEAKTTQLGAAYYCALDLIQYQSPIEQGLQKISYAQMPIIDKLEVITDLVKAFYSIGSKIYQQRIILIAQYIKLLSVDFNNHNQAEAFKSLTDIVYTNIFLKSDVLEKAFQTVWVNGGKNPQFMARNEDLRTAVMHFVCASTREDALRHAEEIVNICDRIIPKYRSIIPQAFGAPSIVEIEDALARDGQWHPPYAQYIQWYREQPSRSLQYVLAGMNIDEDPWVKAVFETNPSPSFYAINNGISGASEKELEQYVRDEKGTVVGKNAVYSPYPWQDSPPDTSKDALLIDHQKQALEKKRYEEQLLPSINWSLLKDDFTHFIAVYGQLLEQPESILPTSSPFAERFFEELIKLLPEADNHFKRQLAIFFNARGNDVQEDSILATNRFDTIRKSKSRIFYFHASESKPFTLQAPFIKFLLHPLAKPFFSEEKTFDYLYCDTEDFRSRDSAKRLSENFAIHPQKLLSNYPKDIKTVADLDHLEYEGGHSRVVVSQLEAERLAYEQQDTINLEEFIALKNLSRPLLIDSCSLPEFFKLLKDKTLHRCLNTEDCSQLVANYRIAVANRLIRDNPLLRENTLDKIQSSIKLLPIAQRIECIKNLFKPETIKLSLQPTGEQYDGYIANPEIRNWAINELTDALASQLGPDQADDVAYQEAAKQVIEEIAENTSGVTRLDILCILAMKINAQKQLAYFIRTLYVENAQTDALSKRFESIAIELLINECSRNEELRDLLLSFLASPSAFDSEELDKLCDYLWPVRYAMNVNEKVELKDNLYQFHRNFRACSMELRTAYLEMIIFPLDSNDEEQFAILNKLIEDVFPITQSEETENKYARCIIDSYFSTVDLIERRLLATALFVANMQEEGQSEYTTGYKLNTVLSHIGPAGAKLLQAIHSHPQTPQSIKNDLASSKTLFDPPKRWEIIEMIDQSGLFEKNANNLNPITLVGELVGAGSFGITVFNTLDNNTQVADTFLRENALVRVEREFSLMGKAIIKVVEQFPEMHPIIDMIEEAHRSAKNEADMELAEQGNSLAEQSYQNVRVLVDQMMFTHQVMPVYQTDVAFKRADIASGEHFNDLPTSPHKQALAKAMIATQLSLRLAGLATDLDRHGGNVKVQNNTLFHFDFGAMNLHPISDEDKKCTGILIADTVLAVINGDSFIEALLSNIQNISVSEETRRYLNGFSKDILALGDYLCCVDPTELTNLMAKCLVADNVDRQIKTAFEKRLSYYSPIVFSVLKWKAQKSSVHVYLNASSNENIAGEYIPSDASIDKEAECAIHFGHINNHSLDSFSIQNKSQFTPEQQSVFKAIDELAVYGNHLLANENKKGQYAVNLAYQLQREFTLLLKNKIDNSLASRKINALLTKGKVILREDRRALDIIAHIALSLTGIGLLVMLANKYKHGTFFLVDTKRGKLLDEVESTGKAVLSATLNESEGLPYAGTMPIQGAPSLPFSQ